MRRWYLAEAGVKGAASGAGRDKERSEHDGESGTSRYHPDRRGDHYSGANGDTPGSLDKRDVDVRTAPAELARTLRLR
jgi:hypothetical protein